LGHPYALIGRNGVRHYLVRGERVRGLHGTVIADS
jgi:hypothetical protein